MLSPIPCPPLVSPLECPGGDRFSTPTPTRGLGTLPWPVGRAPPLCFSALPAIWATPSFWLFHCAKCFSALPPSAQGSPRPKQDAQVTRGFWEGGSTNPRNASCLDYPLHQANGPHTILPES